MNVRTNLTILLLVLFCSLNTIPSLFLEGGMFYIPKVLHDPYEISNYASNVWFSIAFFIFTLSCIYIGITGKIKYAIAWTFFIMAGWNLAQFIFELLIFANPDFINHKGDLFDYNKWVLTVVTAIILAGLREISINRQQHKNATH